MAAVGERQEAARRDTARDHAKAVAMARRVARYRLDVETIARLMD